MDQFRAPSPPALDSAEYATAFDEVKRLGGDGIVTPTERTAEQTEIGIHWAFDKTEGIAQGRRMADYVFENAFVKQRR
jgi:hypothetical protein